MKPTFQLESPETGTNYWIYLQVPREAPPAGGWPAMLFTDGDNQFEAAVSAYAALRSAAAIPPLLLVGVGYGASYGQPGNERGRDYTPTPNSLEPASGGAKEFHAFVTDTLWLELARRHPVDPAVRGIGGHSLGSLYGLYALFQPKPFFSHYLMSAPSIWWDDRSILKQACQLRERRRALDAALYLAVGGRDSRSMIGDLKLLEAQLAERPFDGLRVTSERFPKRTHYNALAETFPGGLKALFGTPR